MNQIGTHFGLSSIRHRLGSPSSLGASRSRKQKGFTAVEVIGVFVSCTIVSALFWANVI